VTFERVISRLKTVAAAAARQQLHGNPFRVQFITSTAISIGGSLICTQLISFHTPLPTEKVV